MLPQCILLLIGASFAVATGPILDTHLGKFEGAILDLGEDGKVERYFGIPFARPPINEKRFEKPLDGEPSTEVRSALSPGFACKQPSSIFMNITGDEDCLTVGVLKPVEPSADPKGYPALFFIHGGGYQVGLSASHLTEESARHFAAKGIVVIAPQYRLSLSGFASTGPESFPGNYGLWDLRRALLWTRKNAKALGIDPKRITVGGHSAGASAVGLLTVSEQTRDLFAQAIQISGATFNDWSISNKAIATTERIAEHFKCDAAKSSEVKKCLRKHTYDELMAAWETLKTPEDLEDFSPIDFTPRLDADFFSTDLPQLIDSAPPKPTLISLAENEGILFSLFVQMNVFGSHVLTPEEQKAFGRKEFEEFVGRKIATKRIYGDKAEKVQKKIVDYYLKEAPKNPKDNMFYLITYAKLIGDLLFAIPHMTEVRLKTAAGWPVYQLYNTYNQRLERIGYQPRGAANPSFRVATHGIEHGYLFGNDFFSQEEFNAEDLKFRKHLVDAFVNFIKNKTPKTAESPNYQATSAAKPFVFSELNTDVKLRDSLLAEDFQFWLKLGKDFDFDLVRGVHKKTLRSRTEL